MLACNTTNYFLLDAGQASQMVSPDHGPPAIAVAFPMANQGGDRGISHGTVKVTDLTLELANPQVHVHWLTTVLVRQDKSHHLDRDLAYVVSLIESLVPADHAHRNIPWKERGYREGYRRTSQGPLGSALAFNPVSPTKTGADHMRLVLPGTFMDVLGLGEIRKLMEELGHRFEVRVTRIDIAFDHCPLTVIDVCRAVRTDNVSTQLRRNMRWDERPVVFHDFRVKTTDTIPEHSLMIGSPDSRRRVRVYDRRGFVRMELVLRDQNAHRTWTELIRDDPGLQNFTTKAVGLLRSTVDFVDRSPGKKANRCPALSWWKRFVGQVQVYRTSATRRRTKTLETQKRWLEQTVAATLYQVLCSLSKEDQAAYIRHLALHGQAQIVKRKAASHSYFSEAHGQMASKPRKTTN